MTAADHDVQLCTFFVGNLLLALPVADVVEVVSGDEITPVPLAPSGVVGLLNLRGRIVAAVDARTRLGLEPRPADDEPAHVIVQLPTEQVSLVVDRTSDVVTVAPEDREDVPETVSPEIRRLLTSSYQGRGSLLLVLDPELVLADI